jgi:RNA polymerase sigma-70 factor, ECF subfamily
LIVFYFRGMDLAAAASTLGVPEGTLKARLARRRALLRRKLGPEMLVSRISGV